MSDIVITVRQLIENTVAIVPDKVFCRFLRGDELCQKTYREFYEDSLSICRYIRDVDPIKSHIAFIGKTSYEYIATLTGMLFSGNTVVPFDPAISVDEAVKLFDNSDIKMLFCEEESVEKAKEISDRYGRLEQIVSLGDWQWFDNIFKKYNSDSEYAHLSDDQADPDACAMIVYTSGTTGDRKGVILSNRNLAINNCYNEWKTDEDDQEFSILPMHHVFCYCCEVLKTVYDKGTLCINGSLADMYKNFHVFEPTIMRIVPAIAQSILTRIKIAERRHPELTPRQAAETVVGKNLRRMASGGAFLSGTLIDELQKYGITARQGYGMTEAGPRVSTVDYSEDSKYSNGKVISVIEPKIAEDGEILIKGPSIFGGYYKMPEATKEVFTDDGYFKTGDLGYLKDGHIYLIGRKKNLIILSNGENISPETIENRFIDDGIIKEIVCYGKNDGIVAEIYPNKELAEAQGIDDILGEIGSIVERVNTVSPSDQQISDFVVRDQPFVKTASGKIKRTEFYFEKR